MNQGTCETCRWWNKPMTWNGKSRCQFDPPQCIVNSGGDYEDVWPFTSSDDWCSHHTPKPDEKPPQQACTVLGWNNASEIKPLPATGEKGEG